MSYLENSLSFSSIKNAELFLKGSVIVDLFNSTDGINFMVIRENEPYEITIKNLKLAYENQYSELFYNNPVAKVETGIGHYAYPENEEYKKIIITFKNGKTFESIIKEGNIVNGSYEEIDIPDAGTVVNKDTVEKFLSKTGRFGLASVISGHEYCEDEFIPKSKGFLFTRYDRFSPDETMIYYIPITIKKDNSDGMIVGLTGRCPI